MRGELVVGMPQEDGRVFMGVARHLSSTLRGELVEAMPLGIYNDGVVRGCGWCDAIVVAAGLLGACLHSILRG